MGDIVADFKNAYAEKDGDLFEDLFKDDSKLMLPGAPTVLGDGRAPVFYIHRQPFNSNLSRKLLELMKKRVVSCL